MPAIYKPQLITTIPYYDTGHVNRSANVMHWLGNYTGNLTSTQLTGIQTIFDNAWSAAWASLGSADTRYLGAWVIDMASSTGQQVTNAQYISVPGSNVGPPVSDNVAALISLKGTLRYKGGHARIYVPGLLFNYTNTDGATIPASTLTRIDNLWETALGAMAGVSAGDGGPFKPVIWHKKLKSNPNSTEDILYHVSQPVLASQRRRLRKVSRHKTKVTTP